MKTQLIPEVGMGATGGFGSDCYPYTIVGVSPDRKTIAVTRDTHKPVAGFDYYSNQVYEYSSNYNGAQSIFTQRKNGRWVKQGDPMRTGRELHLGTRIYYQDPSF